MILSSVLAVKIDNFFGEYDEKMSTSKLISQIIGQTICL